MIALRGSCFARVRVGLALVSGALLGFSSVASADEIEAPKPVAPAPPPTAPAVSVPAHAVRLHDLEARVDGLKAHIRQTQAGLSLIGDALLQTTAAARSEIALHDEMSGAFRLTRALVVLDGTPLYNREDDTGALADQKDIPLYSGTIPPGDHTVSVLLNFQGNGSGVFTYLRGYKFEVKSSHSFTAVEGKTLVVTGTALERGTVTTPLEQRPGVEWQEKVQPFGVIPTVSSPAPKR
jgi:hypothetical protein